MPTKYKYTVIILQWTVPCFNLQDIKLIGRYCFEGPVKAVTEYIEFSPYPLLCSRFNTAWAD